MTFSNFFRAPNPPLTMFCSDSAQPLILIIECDQICCCCCRLGSRHLGSRKRKKLREWLIKSIVIWQQRRKTINIFWWIVGTWLYRFFKHKNNHLFCFLFLRCFQKTCVSILKTSAPLLEPYNKLFCFNLLNLLPKPARLLECLPHTFHYIIDYSVLLQHNTES